MRKLNRNIKKVMVLAGGNDQIELIKGIRKRYDGVEIILIDMSPNVRAREYADKQLIISTMDFGAVLKAAIDENIDMIIVACGDQPLRTMAYVSEKLNLPCYLTYQQSLNLTNKILMKDLMIKAGIPTSKYKKINISEDINTEDLEFPLVIKPVDNNGSKGITKVFNYEQLKTAIEEAKKYSKNSEIIIEEFKQGTELSVEAFIKNGEPHIIIITQNNKIRNRNTFTICQNTYINQLNEKTLNELKDIIKSIGKTFEIDNVPLLIQLINGPTGLNVIEFSARTGGGSKLFFIREMEGVDVIENLLDITEGKEPNISKHSGKPFGCINYIYVKPGIFKCTENLTELIEKGFIKEFYQYKPFGCKIGSNDYSSDRPAGFLVTADSEVELQEKIRHIDSNLKILDEKGNDIMIHGLYNF